MHPIGVPQGLPSRGDSWRPADRDAHFASRGRIAAKPPANVVFVGRIAPGTLIHDGLLDAREFRASFLHDYRELWISSSQHEVHVVVLQNSLCSFELAEAARLVRCRWPGAKILIIRSGQASIDRALYDQRLHPPVRQEVLVEQIFSLTHALHEGEDSGND